MRMRSYLYISANPKAEEESNSLRVGRALIRAVRRQDPQARIDEIDVYREPIPLIDGRFLKARARLAAGADVSELPAEEQAVVRDVFRFTDQFIAADVYIFAYPLWNFGIPPLLKAYVDTIKVARKTFRYTPQGPVPLLSGKKAVLIQSSGDVYSEGPLKEFEHGSRYLSAVLSFIGVDRIRTILMEGMDGDKALAETRRNEAIAEAERMAELLAADGSADAETAPAPDMVQRGRM
jgi:FMN-dependent NADH-azoreductase